MEENNVENVIAYASTLLSKAAINWTTLVIIGYAIVYGFLYTWLVILYSL
jgi:hypothetical protein